MSRPVLTSFKQEEEAQNQLTPQPPKESWLNGRRKRPPQLPRNGLSGLTLPDDMHTQPELSSIPSVTTFPPPPKVLPPLPPRENLNGEEILSFFNSYLSLEEVLGYSMAKEDAEPNEHLVASPGGQTAPRFARRVKKKPSKLPNSIRAEASYHGKLKEERLEQLRATPINDSPAQLSGMTHQLPERRPDAKYTVVLDIDNTLVHASPSNVPTCAFEIDVLYEKRTFHYWVSVRPFVKELLDYLRENTEFEVIVFTAAKEQYGREIIRNLDPEGTLDHHFLSDIHIRRSGEIKAKDLQRLGRPVETICIVEDTPESYKYQRRSSFPLSRWQYSMEGDTELQDLLGVLEKVKQSGNLIGELDDFKASKLSNQSFKMVLGETLV